MPLIPVYIPDTTELRRLRRQSSSQSQSTSQPAEERKPSDTAISPPGILKPGSKIRPRVNLGQIESIAERLYGVTISEIKELISYDDKNYLINADRNIKNPLLPKWEHGYVMKILNALDSINSGFVEAQTHIMLFLREQHFVCPKPIRNINGRYYSLEALNGMQCSVRLLEYQPGKVLNEVPTSSHLFYQCGEFIAKFDRALKGLSHDGLKNRTSLWMLQSMPRLRDFLYVIEDHGRKAIVEQIVEKFEQEVLKKLDSFEKGIIHGDFNEHNILVNKIPEKDEYRVEGILDFGDISVSPLIFELGIAICYSIIHSKDIATGGLVIAGYSSVRLITEQEKHCLKYCVAARLCQSLVLGAYTHSVDPNNDYLLSTQKDGWGLLESLWKKLFEKIDEIWDETADNYVKQSTK